MMPVLHLTAAALAIPGWLPARRVARAPLRRPAWLLVDAAVPLTAYLLLLSFSARPLFAAVVTCLLGCGYAFADRSKRRVLAEPVVFTDVFQAVDIARHPELALPFPHKGRIVAGVAAVLALFAAIFHFESAAWPWSPWPPLLAAAALAAVVYLLAGPLNAVIAPWLRHTLSGDVLRDPAIAGPFAALLAHGLLARAERSARQAAARPHSRPAAAAAADARPVVLVQSESFFDARRLHRGIRRDLLPAFDSLIRSGAQWGRLSVPSWGANTVRTEFAVLSGLSEQQLGFDRFNPYHRFATAPVASLAWRLRGEGYRTLCLHPFDRRFYGRDRVMANLGFDAFLAEEAFAGAQRVNGYVSDLEMARVAREILREEGPRTFLFLVTMENHGPWTAPCEGPLEGLAPGLSLPPKERHALQRYLLSLRNADAMLQELAQAVGDGVLSFYGDHLPAFASLFEQCGMGDLRTDYLMWSQRTAGAGQHLDLQAQELGEMLLRLCRSSRSLPRSRTALG